MRSKAALRILFRLLVCAALGGCASTPRADRSDALAAPAPTRATDPQAPAKELELFPRQLPPVLADALRYPYRPPVPATCPALTASLLELELVLGADFDDPRQVSRGDQSWKRMLVSGVKSAIPYFGWLRRLSGAERRQRVAQAAYTAGAARRGYLKGVGAQLGCEPPAAPKPLVADAYQERR